MDNAAFNQVTASTTDMAKMIAQGQADLLEAISTCTRGTPIAPFFDMATQMHRSAMDNLHLVLDVAGQEPMQPSTKTSAQAVKKTVNTQADMMAEADAKAVAAGAKVKKEAPAKMVDVASTDKMAAIYDDLTAVTGIGPSTMKKLHEEGIRTVSDLASTSSKDLTALLEKANVRIKKYSPADWIADAKNLLKASKAA